MRFHKILYGLLICFAALQASAQNADIDLLRSIYQHRDPALDKPLHYWSQSTYPVTLAVPVSFLLYGYIGHHPEEIKQGWQSVAGIGIGAAFTYGLKYLVQRKRPYERYPEIVPYENDQGYSFPSGHASMAFNTATTLSLYCPRWYVVIPAYAWAGGVAYARLQLGMHYPGDVLTGALIGAGTSWLSFEGRKWLEGKRNQRNKSAQSAF